MLDVKIWMGKNHLLHVLGNMSFIASSPCGLKIRPVRPTSLLTTIREIRNLVPNSPGKSKIDVSNEEAKCGETFSEVT